ncbi:MAG: tyrosine--tRNA ligase [Spirochaetaceae bacterium]|jgi:tyrosyl-tRNA synthetase|nr:tyrosine--tRNA ligase [Spirochaetaceae bacterium]
MNSALENLKERGFISQCTDIDGLSRLMDEKPVTFYVGCDPTGKSLHIGHIVPFFAFRHLVMAGHRGVALIGGGTARIGDPSGKSEMRKMLDYSELDENAAAIRGQLSRFLGGGDSVCFENNKEWLAGLNYIDFLRDIGRHFSVNRMLSFEAYKMRMETGLSFIEFNYQLLQSYDFWQLYKRHGCRLQIGGDDQWGNIVAGMELIRRLEAAETCAAPAGNGYGPDATGGHAASSHSNDDEAPAFGLTFPLVTTSDGKKMGKTEKGALFLDPAITSPYEFFQYWRNVRDDDVLRFLLLFTFLPAADCRALCAAGANPNAAKERLAYEITGLIHGKAEAEKALSGAKAAFGGGGDAAAMPARSLPLGRFEAGYAAVDLFTDCALCATKSEARRLIEQGGAFAGADASSLIQVKDVHTSFTAAVLSPQKTLVLRAGKKRYCLVTADS